MSESSSEQNHTFFSYLQRWWTDPFYAAAFLLSFALVFIKKWEPGGTIDASWYSTMARNIFLSGDYFTFGINPHFFAEYYDHFPLTYWTMAKSFDFFGVSAFSARLYFLFSSFLTCLLVFESGRLAKNSLYGLVTLLMLGLSFTATKYMGSIKIDIPLTLSFVACYYFFFRAQKCSSLNYYWVSVFFTLGVFTKGPVIGGFFLSFLAWLLITGSFSIFTDKHFWGALGFMLLLLCIPFLPSLHFKGQNYYSFYLASKKSYLSTGSTGESIDYWLYVRHILKLNPLTSLILPLSLWSYSRNRKSETREFRSHYIFALAWICSILIPFSFFKVKLYHYMLPLFPAWAFACAYLPYRWLQNRGLAFAMSIKAFALLIILVMVAFPIKTTGQREKLRLNLINVLKFDTNISEKTVVFPGGYYDDMRIFQMFKFYGGMDLKPVRKEDLESIPLQGTHVVLKRKWLPLNVDGKLRQEEDCFLKNRVYCVILDPTNTQFEVPNKTWPHEVYP
jgi:4-amino-4-deoxy-L-arabinose transferase-like glycosyltransferase